MDVFMIENTEQLAFLEPPKRMKMFDREQRVIVGRYHLRKARLGMPDLLHIS